MKASRRYRDGYGHMGLSATETSPRSAAS